jgi:hypothetical protein
MIHWIISFAFGEPLLTHRQPGNSAGIPGTQYLIQIPIRSSLARPPFF